MRSWRHGRRNSRSSTSGHSICARLWRLAIWGSSAAGALTLAVVAGYSDAGSRRLMAAAPAPNAAGTAQQAAARPPPPRPTERRRDRRLAEARASPGGRPRAAGGTHRHARAQPRRRDRLDQAAGRGRRRCALRRLPREPAAAAAAPRASAQGGRRSTPPPSRSAPAQPARAPASPPSAARAGRGQGRRPGGAARRCRPQPSRPRSTTEFGVDIGGAASFDGLRVLWASTKGSNAALFEGLHPVVAMRENSATKAVELRLVAGPLANAEAAARLCATLVGRAPLLPAGRVRRPASGACRQCG